MKTNIEVKFADGEISVVAFSQKSPRFIDLVIRAWGLLYQRDVEEWKPTSAAAEFWYDAKTKMINRYDSRGYHDMLIDLFPIVALREKLGKQAPGK
jgi:hypothetical protein